MMQEREQAVEIIWVLKVFEERVLRGYLNGHTPGTRRVLPQYSPRNVSSRVLHMQKCGPIPWAMVYVRRCDPHTKCERQGKARSSSRSFQTVIVCILCGM